MKTIKRNLKLLLSLIIITSLIPSVFATNITITGGSSDAEYSAYILLLANNLGNENYSYMINDKYASIIYKSTSKSNGADAIEYISSLKTSEIQSFADSVYRNIISDSTEADYQTATNVFENVESGYYLIAETKTGGSSDVISLVMLDTAGKANITIQTKEDVPSLTQKVLETDDTTGTQSAWQDAADYDIGDTVKFMITGTLPSNIKSYANNYIYNFDVSLSDGLTLICNPDNKDDDQRLNDIVVYINEYKLDAANYTVTIDSDYKSFRVKTINIKNQSQLDENSVLTVEYSATLNDGAQIGGSGNSSYANIEYSNSPYGEGTGTSAQKKSTVFTYGLTFDNVNNIGAALSGAGYTLYKYSNASKGYNPVGSELKGVSTFSFMGLDSGKYKLVQTTTPADYNKAEDLIFVIEAKYDEISDNPQLLSLTVKDESGNVLNDIFTSSIENGIISTKMINAKGIELPSTGGIGTTVFYIVGGILMAAAIILFAVKSKTEKNS